MPPKRDAVIKRLKDTQYGLRERARRVTAAERPNPDDARVVALSMIAILDDLFPESAPQRVDRVFAATSLAGAKPATLRGSQIDIGGRIIRIPQEVPVDDPQVLAQEELIDEIAEAAEPSTNEAKLAKKLRAMLRDDIEEGYRMRRAEDDAPLFDQKVKEVVVGAAQEGLREDETLTVTAGGKTTTVRGKKPAKPKGGA